MIFAAMLLAAFPAARCGKTIRQALIVVGTIFVVAETVQGIAVNSDGGDGLPLAYWMWQLVGLAEGVIFFALGLWARDRKHRRELQSV